MKLYHGTVFDFSEIDLALSKSAKDFGKGFYLSADRQQAENWSRFKSLQSELPAKVYEYYFDENLLDDKTLKVKRFNDIQRNGLNSFLTIGKICLIPIFMTSTLLLGL